MSTPTKTCRRCLGKGRVLVNTGNGRTEVCPRCKDKPHKLNGSVCLPAEGK